jgi:cysteine synthase A
VKVPDALSLAAMRHVSETLGRRVGGSTGTNFVGVLAAAEHMRREGREGSIVTILCDGGERYSHSYYNPAWYLEQGIDIVGSDAAIARAFTGDTAPDVPWLAS